MTGRFLSIVALVAGHLLLLTWLLTSVHATDTPLVIPLFGRLRILAVYCLASLPLTWRIAVYLPGSRTIVIGLASLAISSLAAFSLPAINHFLELQNADFFQKSGARSLLAFLFVWPVGYLLSESVFAANDSATNDSGRQRQPVTNTLIIAIACALALPAVYVHSQVKILYQACLGQPESSRLVADLTSCSQLWELSGDSRIGQQRLVHRLRDLKHQYRKLTSEVVKPMPPEADENAWCQRAMQLLSLGRPAEAATILGGLATTPSVLLLRAIAARELKQWENVDRFSRAILAQTSQHRLAMELLAEALHARRDFQQAVATYEQILTDEPSNGMSNAMIHVRLGRVHMDCGARTKASEHFNIAKRLAPNLQPELLSSERTILQNSCGLR